MEYEELKSLWAQYDNKLNNLEKMNKKMLSEFLSRKPRRMISFLKYKCIQSMVVYPIILFFIVYSNFYMEKVGIKFIIGCVFSFVVLIYLMYANFKTFSTLKALNMVKDTVIESTKKTKDLINIYHVRRRNSVYTLPLLFFGIILIYWNNYHFNTLTILWLACLFVVLFSYNLRGSTIHKNMLKKLENEIIEFNE